MENNKKRYSVVDRENNSMKFCYALVYTACLIAAALAQDTPVSDKKCPLACARNYYPVCGMRQENGVWKKETFPNECEMLDENECHNGNWIPCPSE